MNLLQNIEFIIEKRGLTLTQVEKDCGLSKSSMRKWSENFPSIDKVLKVAQYLDVSVDFLLTGKNSETTEIPQDKDEVALLEEFRQLDPQERRIILGKIAEMNYNKRGTEEITEEIGIHLPIDSHIRR